MLKPEIETLASREVYRNRWMRVREDAILRQDGSQGIYGVVEKPDFAVVAALDQGRIHLVQQYRYPVAARYWEFPQGTLEAGAVDPLTLAKTELREETGLIAGRMLHAGRLFLAYGYSTQAYDIFLATQLEQGDAQLESEEQGLIAQAFGLDEVEAMIRDGEIRDATTVAAFALLRLKNLL